MNTSQTTQQMNENSQRERLTVVVPCLNEENSIEGTIADILKLIPEIPVDVRILMIDDGSTDETRKKMEEILRKHNNCDLIVNQNNLGLGRSVLNAYETIEPGSWVTVLPGDNEIMFQSIKNYIPACKDHDIILGYLHNPVIRTITRRFASFMFSKTVNILYGFPYRYLNGLKMYRIEAFKDIEVCSSGHAFNAELLAKALLRNPLLRIGEVPFSARGRSKGNSKAFRLKSIWQAVKEVIIGYKSVIKFRNEITLKN